MPTGTIGLATYRWGNARKAWFLLALYPVVTAALLWVQIYLIYAVSTQGERLTQAQLIDRTTDFYLSWGWIFLALLAGWFWYAWTHAASIIRGLCLSRPVTAAEQPSLYAMVESVCISQGIPTPEVEIVDTIARNSFVTALGNDDTYRLFLTQGLIDNLERDELEAVIAHEVAHIINGDTRLLSISIAFTDLYPLIMNTGRKPRFDESPAAAAADDSLAYIFLVHPLAFVLLMPLAVGFFAMSLIRVFLFLRREHDADAVAIEITKNPDALMRALIRINRRARIPQATQDIRFLCIDNPHGGFFSTHPRLSSRLAAISELTGTPIPDLEPSTPASNLKRFQDNPLLKRVFKKGRGSSDPKPFNTPWR